MQWKTLLQNDFFRNFLKLFSSSFVSQAIVFGIAPLLTRLYSHEAFGVYTVFISITGFLSIVTTLRLELALVLPANDKAALNLFALSFLSNFILNILSFLVILLFSEHLKQFIDIPDKTSLWLVPVYTFLLGTIQLLSYWFNRKKEFGKIGWGLILKSIVISLVQISIYYLANTQDGLILGTVVGSFISALYLIYFFWKRIQNQLSQIRWRSMYSQLLQYRNIPSFTMLTDLLNSFSTQLPVFVLTIYYGVVQTGYFGLTIRIVGVASLLIGQSVAQVFYQKAAEKYKKKDGFYMFVAKTYRNLFWLALIPFFILFLIAPHFFTFVFGAKWEPAGTFARYLIPWLFLSFVNLPLIDLVNILQRQKIYTIYSILLVGFRFSALYCGYFYFNSVYVSLLLFSIVGVVFNVFLSVFLLQIANQA